MKRGTSAYNFISLSIVIFSVLMAAALPAVIFRLVPGLSYTGVYGMTFEVYCPQDGEKTELSFEDYVCSRAAVYINEDDKDEYIKAVLLVQKNNAVIKIFKSDALYENQAESYDIEKGREKYIRSAYDAISDELVSYDGRLVYLPYHMYSYKSTCDALVYGMDIPYLKEKETPEPLTYRNISFTYNELYRRLNGYLGVTLTGDCKEWIKGISKDSSGRVVEVNTMLQKIKGEDFSKALGLDSLFFTYECLENNISFTLLSEGDGLGMSLCGAKILAERGYGYKEIIEYYYTDCRVISDFQQVSNFQR